MKKESINKEDMEQYLSRHYTIADEATDEERHMLRDAVEGLREMDSIGSIEFSASVINKRLQDQISKRRKVRKQSRRKPFTTQSWLYILVLLVLVVIVFIAIMKSV